MKTIAYVMLWVVALIVLVIATIVTRDVTSLDSTLDLLRTGAYVIGFAFLIPDALPAPF